MVGKEVKEHCRNFLEAGYKIGFVVGIISVGLVWFGIHRDGWLMPTWVSGVAIAIAMGMVMKFKSKVIVEDVLKEDVEVAGEKAKGQWEE